MLSCYYSPHVRLLLSVTVTFLTCAKGAFVLHVDNQSAVTSQLNYLSSESAGNFGTAPAVGENIPSLARTATNGTGFGYTVLNRDIIAPDPSMSSMTFNDLILSTAMGTIANLYHDTNATFDIEAAVSQDGASLPTFGIDSNALGANSTVSGIASRNAAVLDFGGAINGFTADFLDLESSANQEGLVILGLNGNIVFSQDLVYSGTDNGDGEVHNIGALASNGMTFDTAIIILGDDNDTDLTNGYGGNESWALANVQVGIIPEPSSSILCLLASLSLLTRRKRSA